MNTALGSQPAARFSTQPTTSPVQTDSLSGFINLLNTVFNETAPGATTTAGQAQAALPGQLAYQAPPAAPAPQIDATQAFQQGVVQPVTQDFLQQTLPSIAGQFGAGSGGAFGSGSAEARNQAATGAERALAQQGSQFAYNAAAANQTAALQTNLANLAAANQAAQIRNTALGTAPGTAQAATGALQPILQQLMQTYLQPTQQTLGVGTGGSTGLVQGALSNPGLGFGAASLLQSLLAGGGAGGFGPATAASLSSGSSALDALAPALLAFA